MRFLKAPLFLLAASALFFFGSLRILSFSIGLATAVIFFGVGLACLIYWFAYVERRVGRLIQNRPWLLGPVHGTFSAAFVTIWHRDFGMQLVSQDLPDQLCVNSYVVRAEKRPFALVPSSSFYESDWHFVLDTIALLQPGFLIPIPPPSGSHVCTLLSERLNFLETRLRGYHWSPSEGGASWVVAAVLTYFVLIAFENAVPMWLVFAMIPTLVLVFFLIRVTLWTLHTKWQFANDSRGYFSAAEAETETETGRTVSWFDGEVVFWCVGRMWIHFPIRYVEHVRVGYSAIEFRARGMDLIFHREGFQKHAAWLAACEAVAGHTALTRTPFALNSTKRKKADF